MELDCSAAKIRFAPWRTLHIAERVVCEMLPPWYREHSIDTRLPLVLGTRQSIFLIELHSIHVWKVPKG
jgi:hypothetical protein